MAIKIAATRTEPVPGSIVKFTITSADNGDGQYELLPIPKRAKGISLKVSGTAGGATFKAVYKNQTDGTFEDFQDGTITVAEQININCGQYSETYLDASSTSGTTDVDVEASIYYG
jgi:hypothetical protein